MAVDTYRKCAVCESYFHSETHNSVSLRKIWATPQEYVVCGLDCAVALTTQWQADEVKRLEWNKASDAAYTQITAQMAKTTPN